MFDFKMLCDIPSAHIKCAFLEVTEQFYTNSGD